MTVAALITIQNPSKALLDIILLARKNKDTIACLDSILNSPSGVPLTATLTKIKCATEKTIKLCLELPNYSAIDNLEWAVVLFPDKHRMTYPVKQYPNCRVEFLDEETNTIGSFTCMEPRQEMPISALTSKMRKKYSATILAYISK